MKLLFRIFILSLILTTLSFGKSVTIAVAANVGYVIESLEKEFNKIYPDIKIKFVLGSSGKLVAQIKNGAPFEIFMSADMKYPQALYDENIAITRPLVYAKGSLIIFSTKDLNLSNNLDFLKNNEIKRVAIANPKTAPYGKATIEALEKLSLANSLKDKFVFGESISQTVTYSTTATDVGFISKSSLYSPNMKKFKENVNWKEIDSQLHSSINQGIVVLKNGELNKDVSLFYSFIFSKTAKKIFEDFGYKVE